MPKVTLRNKILIEMYGQMSNEVNQLDKCNQILGSKKACRYKQTLVFL